MNVRSLMPPGSPPLPGSERFAHLRAMCAVLIARALLTLKVAPDPHARFLRGPKSCMPEPIRDIMDAYGYEEPRRPKFRATPRDVSNYLPVLTILLPYLESLPDGRRLLQVTMARANGVAYWKIAAKFGGCSDSNVRRLWNVAIDAMTRQFWREIEVWSDGLPMAPEKV